MFHIYLTFDRTRLHYIYGFGCVVYFIHVLFIQDIFIILCLIQMSDRIFLRIQSSVSPMCFIVLFVLMI